MPFILAQFFVAWYPQKLHSEWFLPQSFRSDSWIFLWQRFDGQKIEWKSLQDIWRKINFSVKRSFAFSDFSRRKKACQGKRTISKRFLKNRFTLAMYSLSTVKHQKHFIMYIFRQFFLCFIKNLRVWVQFFSFAHISGFKSFESMRLFS